MGWTEDKWRRESYRSTVIGVPIAIITIVLVAGALGFAILQLQSNIDTTNNLAELVHTNQEQTKALQETIKEIQHQTMVSAYTNGGIFDVRFEHCSFSKHYDGDEIFLGTSLNVKPIMINEKKAQTIVPFYLFIDYKFHGYNEEREKYVRYFNLGTETFIYNIGHESSQQEVDIQAQLDQGEDEGYSNIKIIAEYAFRPFSSVKDVSLSDQSETTEQEFAILKLTENGWHVQDFREKYPCR